MTRAPIAAAAERLTLSEAIYVSSVESAGPDTGGATCVAACGVLPPPEQPANPPARSAIAAHETETTWDTRFTRCINRATPIDLSDRLTTPGPVQAEIAHRKSAACNNVPNLILM